VFPAEGELLAYNSLMPAHSFEAFFRSLGKGELASVYYLYGAEDVLKDEAARAILDRALDPSLRDFNFDQRSAAQLDAEEVHALCNTLPMMAERRVVLLRDVEGWKRKTRGRSEFLRYLERPSPETVVILIQGSGEEDEDKELARGAYTVRFDQLPPDRARRWLLHRADRLGVTLEPEAAEHLVLSVGAELGALASELDKLASLPEGEPLTAERVGELVGVRHGETVWDWRDAVLEDQSGRAASMLPSVLAQPGVSGVRLVTMLGTALVGLGIARAHYDRGLRGGGLEGAVLKSLFNSRPAGLLGYREEARRWSRWAPRWPARRIRAALSAARQTDEALKSTTVSDERGLLTDFVLRLAKWGDGNDGEDGDGGEDGEGRKMSGLGKGRGRQLAGQRAMSFFSVFPVFSVFSVLSALSAIPARAQTDPRLVDVVRHAQEGRSDSARVKVRRLLAATSPSDSLYPQIIYTQAMVASDANEMRRQLQRVAVEYSSSSWADDALLRLVQLDYASGNLEGSARNLERIRLDYPGSQLLPQAAYWAARTYFDQKNPELACRWIAEGLGSSRGNIELQNQLGYLDQRCAVVRANLAARPAADSPPGGARADTDTTAPPAAAPAPTAAPQPAPPTPSVATPTPSRAQPPVTAVPPPAAVQPDTARRGPPPAAQPAAVAGRFRIQVSAVRSRRTAEANAGRMRDRGLNAMVVEEAGLYKVRVGNYATRNEALADLPNIKAQLGGSPFVVAEP
jgi:DNA polymerase III subunit delta